MPDFATVAARLSEELPRLLAEHRVPGLAVGICDASGQTWTAGFGSTRADGGRPVTARTMFSLQSCSKSYTATAVMLAVQAGLLDLDRPITDYLPSFTVGSAFESVPERKMTLRHLLSHTAGFSHEAPVGNNYTVGRASFDAHCRSISETWLRFPVGHHYEYSNLGIDLAGAILQRVTGRSFTDVMAKTLLRPLGLDRTTFDQRAIAREADRAVGHSTWAKRLPVRIPMIAAGGAYASVEDVCRFMLFHLRRGEALLSPSAAEAMSVVPWPQSGQRLGYGLGLASYRWPAAGVVIGHGGGGFGFLSVMYWSRVSGLGVAILSNAGEHELLGSLADSIFHDLAGPPSPPAVARRREGSDSPSEAERMTGKYVGRSSTFRITLDAEGLSMADHERRRPLVVVAPGEVQAVDSDAEAWRLLPDDRQRSRYLASTHDGAVWYRNELPARPGRHIDPEQMGSYRLRMMGGRRLAVRLGADAIGPFLNVQGESSLRLDQHAPGLFFTTTGEALDLRTSPLTYRNLVLESPADRGARRESGAH